MGSFNNIWSSARAHVSGMKDDILSAEGWLEEWELNAYREFLRDEEKVLGAVVRTKDKIRPVFVSPGHKTNLDTSIKIVLECARVSRLPEPLRRAHLLVNRLRKEI